MLRPQDFPSIDLKWHEWMISEKWLLRLKANWVNVLLFFVFIAAGLIQTRKKQYAAKKAGHEARYLKSPDFPKVEEQEDFDWRQTEPLKFRNFKPKYHLTMDPWTDETAIENLNPSDLLTMDNTYEDRVKYRYDAIKKHGKHIVNVHQDDRIRPAVEELYRFIMGTYLPLRFPQMFKLHEALYEQGSTFMLQNLVTKAMFPAVPNNSTSTINLLEILGRTVDEDFLFLLPEELDDTDNEKNADGVKKEPRYQLQAHVCVCPSGWDPLEKIGMRLVDIHGPVPGYKAKLEGSMDRFFSKLEVGTYVKRSNWGITTNKELYGADTDNHAHSEGGEEELKEVDLENTVLRCERQTLHRLPKSKAIVFAFKTYLYPISDTKEEGLGNELADAIDGLKVGNVPGMHTYKRGGVWGEAVKRYLRS